MGLTKILNNLGAGEREFTKSAQKSKIKLASMLEEGDESNSEGTLLYL